MLRSTKAIGEAKIMVTNAGPGASARGGRRPWLTYVLLFLLLIAIVGAALSALSMSNDRAIVSRQLAFVDEQQRSAQAIYDNLPLAVTGEREVFNQLRAARNQIDDLLVKMAEGTEDTPSLAPVLRPELAKLETEWQVLDEGLDLILQAETSVVELRDLLLNLRNRVGDIAQSTNALASALQSAKASPNQALIVQAQQLFANELASELSAIMDEGIGSRDLDHFRSNVELLSFYQGTVKGLLLGDSNLGIERVKDNSARQALAELGGKYRDASAGLRDIMTNTLVVMHLRDTVDTLTAAEGGIHRVTAELRGAYHNTTTSDTSGQSYVWLFTAMAMLCLIALTILIAMRKPTRAPVQAVASPARTGGPDAAETKATEQRNQDAILRLLDEISVLAEGDLRAQATVTEDMTGAIADAVNYAIEALREIVTNINDTASEVDKASRLSRGRAAQLGQASETQRLGVTRVNESLDAMAGSVERIAQQASESSQVAESSVEIANAGAIAVRDTIAGMDVIRETIQETAKRIKRLGESSQEIGDIVGLIDDIADQTNVLALNAAIQASMAGEAGRGFAVVADEVQRLAERAGQATKQIDNLVKAIQSDTHEAVASMESSTAGVVSGAQLSEDAGHALGRIETVSQQLAERINSITELAHRHTQQTAEIAETIRQIQTISEQTHQGVLANEESVDTLAELADALRQSVEGFRLPERDITATVNLPQQIVARRAAASQASISSVESTSGDEAHGGGSANASAD